MNFSPYSSKWSDRIESLNKENSTLLITDNDWLVLANVYLVSKYGRDRLDFNPVYTISNGRKEHRK